MRWNGEWSFAFVLAVLLTVASPAIAKSGGPFAVGIVEANGNVTPVAAFDGVGWFVPNVRAHWKLGGESLKKWTLWFETAGSSSREGRGKGWAARLSPVRKALTATALVKSKLTWSEGNLTLATDAEDRQAELIRCNNCVPEPKMGIATTGESPELLERLDPEGSESRKIAVWIRDVFNELESRKIRFGSELEEIRRKETPLRVRTAFRIREVAESLYFLQVGRTHADLSCPLHSVLAIWVLAEADGGFTSLGHELTVWDCDGKWIEWDTPLVFWRHTTGVDVLFSRHKYEHEIIFITTVGSGGVTQRTSMEFGGIR